MRVLVAGASGFVGSRLCPALVADGHDVRAMTRHPGKYEGAGTPVHGDVHDPAILAAAFEGCQVAYYLVHSLDSADFERLDAEKLVLGGSWSAYYYNGYVYSNDIQKGFDVLKVTDDAAQSNVRLNSLNPQSQASY